VFRIVQNFISQSH